MSFRKKKNLAIFFILAILILPLYFLSKNIEEDMSKSKSRAPAFEDRPYLLSP